MYYRVLSSASAASQASVKDHDKAYLRLGLAGVKIARICTLRRLEGDRTAQLRSHCMFGLPIPSTTDLPRISIL